MAALDFDLPADGRFQKQFINGAWVDSTNAPNTLDVHDSNTDKVFAKVPNGSKEDTDLAVKAARAAFPAWSATPLAKRAEYIGNILKKFEAKKPEVIENLMKELGSTRKFATEVQVNLPTYHGMTLLSKIGEMKFAEAAGKVTVVKEPIGVVGCITPWNYPLNQISLKVLPALLAGCTVVLKPSEIAPLNAYCWTEAVAEAGLPAGVFNMVVGLGPTCGQPLAEHPDVDLVSFTGSTRAGKQLSQAACQTLKPVRTELGGKSAALLLEDAELEKVVPAFLGQLMNNTGQSCNALSRMLVPRSKYDEAVKLAADFASKQCAGRSDDPKSTMGPLVSKTQWDRVQGLLNKGVEEGARVVVGGPGKPEGAELQEGYFVKPTIFADVKNDMSIAREEIFGPVLSMIPYESEKEGIDIANDTIYGLNNAVASSNASHALRVAAQLRSGMVMVNGVDMDLNAPFGGYKQSGNAREWGLTGFEEYLITKTINVSLEDYEKATKPKAMDTVPILQRLKAHAEAGIEKAVVESNPKTGASVKFSYKELLANVESVSAGIRGLLQGRAEGAPRHVAYLVNPSIAYVVIELSVWASGSLCVPLSVHSPAPELEYFLEQSESPLVITDKTMESKIRPVAEKLGRKVAVITPDDDAQPSSFTLSPWPEVEGTEVAMTGDSPALILYTSGTTGKPKGALHTVGSLTAQMESLSEAWKWSSKDYTLHVLPLHHIHGIQNILNTALFNGACVEVCAAFDPKFCLQRLTSGDCTCFHAVPTIYVKFTQYLNTLDEAGRAAVKEGLRNSSMRYMVSGSAALPVPTMKSWAEISGHVLLERYGMTEIGMGLSNNITGTRYPGCVGWPLPKVEVKFDAEGGILIKAPQVFKEYYRNEEATKNEFQEGGWFKTGDNVSVGGTAEELQALLDDARAVEAATGRPIPAANPLAPEAVPECLKTIHKIMGRSSVDIIKSGGYKISALEIESVLLQHEKIKECAVVGKPDETWGEKVTAVCVLNGELSIKELRDWGKERLASYKVPQELEAVAELPRNQLGKLEKKKILERYKA